MPISPEEQKDLDVFLEAARTLKVKCFDNMKYYQRASPDDLSNMGHKGKSNAEVMAWVYERAQDDIKKLEKEFLKKWPDEK